MDKYDLPVLTASWFYRLGENDSSISDNLRIAKEIGASLHNIMIYTRHADGHVLRNEEIVDCYLRTYDEGLKIGVEPTFELHVNMWSEDVRRVTPVATEVKRRGVPFNLTLDYSHVNFKIGNTEELDISCVREDVETGRLILDPFEPGNLCDEWLSMGIVRWMQVRSAAPDGPKNIWSRFDPSNVIAAVPNDTTDVNRTGDLGRGILYPFTKPLPGEWHSAWHASESRWPVVLFVKDVSILRICASRSDAETLNGGERRNLDGIS